jgi:hypothetical protein
MELVTHLEPKTALEAMDLAADHLRAYRAFQGPVYYHLAAWSYLRCAVAYGVINTGGPVVAEADRLAV